jgi:hypothetical protein
MPISDILHTWPQGEIIPLDRVANLTNGDAGLTVAAAGRLLHDMAWRVNRTSRLVKAFDRGVAINGATAAHEPQIKARPDASSRRKRSP